MHQISFPNPGKAPIFSNFRFAKKNFVSKAFEYKNCLIFDTGNLLAFAELRTEPQAAAPCAYSLCSFRRSYFERDPASSAFGFGNLVSNYRG